MGISLKNLGPYLSVAAAAALWGIIAFFVRGLSKYQFTEMEIVTIRVVYAALFLLIIGIFHYRSQLKIALKDIHLFIGTGVFSIVFFNWCYFTAINQLNISLAVILLYTSPAFVTVLSFMFLKEKLSSKKVGAVIGTIAGCILIAGLNSETSGTITLAGVLIGLGSGLGYALYSIFGKLALTKYPPFTVTLFTFVVAAAALVPVTGLWHKKEVIFEADVVLYSTGLGLLPTVAAYFLYTWGLEKIESSKAAVIATVEPLVAIVLSFFLYQETVNLVQITGSILIILSVVGVNISFTKRQSRNLNIENRFE